MFFRSFATALKRLKSIIRWTIWLVIGVYFTIVILLHLPAIQNFAGHEVSKLLSKKLGTEVRVGKISLGALNHLVIDDISIADQKKKRLVDISRIAVKVDILNLLRSKKILISSAQIFKLQANLYRQNKNTEPNFKFILDSLTSQNNTSHPSFDLQIQSLIIRNSSISYHKWDAPLVRNRFNTRHLEVSDISGHININAFNHNRIDVNVRHLSFKEKSGLKVKHLAFTGSASTKRTQLQDFILEMPNSKISIPKANILYKIANKQIDMNSLRVESIINETQFTPSDFACFFPQLQAFKHAISLESQLSYNRNQIRLNSFKLHSGNKDLYVDIKGVIKDLKKMKGWNIYAKKIAITNEPLNKLSKIFHLPIPKEIKRLNYIGYTGSTKRTYEKYMVDGILFTSEGNLDLNITLNEKEFNGRIKTKFFNIGRLFPKAGIKDIITDISVSGTTDLNKIYAKGVFPLLSYKGYPYRNIYINGEYSNDNFQGMVSLNDLNGGIELKGDVKNFITFIKKRGALAVDATVAAHRVNLSKLKISNIIGNKELSFNLHITGNGSSINDLKGQLSINNFAMTGDGKHTQIKEIKLDIFNSLNNKSLNVKSDLGTLQLSGQYAYNHIASSITNTISKYLPNIFPNKPTYDKTKSNYMFSAVINDSELLNRLTNNNIKTDTYIKVDGNVNESSQNIEIDIKSPSLIISKQHIQKLKVTLSSPQDELLANLSGERVDNNGRRIFIQNNSKVKNGNIHAVTAFDIEGRTPISGNINCNATFNLTNGRPVTYLHFNPSNIQLDTIQLRVQPSDLIYAHNNLNIKHFELSNKNQHITVNGKTSGAIDDSLIVKLKDIDVPYIMDILNFHSVEFDGLASGEVVVKSFFNTPETTARLEIKHFQFENGEMGTLYANSYYNHNAGRINIDAHADAGADSKTVIKGYIDTKNSFIHLPIYASNTYLHFLNKYCSSFMSHINLKANGWCKVVGPLSKINLEGDMYASGDVFIKPIGSKYMLKNGRIRMIPNEIIFDNDTIFDTNNNIGILTGGIHHQSLTNLTYDLDCEARNLLIYNFPKKTGDDTFWGVVKGTGNCAISNKSEGVTMNITLRPEEDSYITYNASENSVDENSFIYWRDLTPKTYTPSEDSGAFNLHNEKANARKDSDFESNLNINFSIHATPDFTLRVLMDEKTGDMISLNGSGDIKATYYNKGGFQLFGNYIIDYGQYSLTVQDIIKKKFEFHPGSTIAFGGNPYDATLNLKGQYTLNSVPLSDLRMGNSFTANNTKVICLLNIGGTPEKPSVTFGIDLPSLSSDAEQMVRSVLSSEQDLNQQIIYLLAVGRFYPPSVNNASNESLSQPGQTTLAMQSILSGTLSQQINTVLSNVIKNNNWNFGANIATGNEGFTNAEYEGLLSGKMLDNRLIINGEFGYRDNVATNTSSFIGDFDIKYLLVPNGNLSINFYNHTNDRYFTRNSLTTQGIGINIKKDFRTLGELFHFTKKKNEKNKRKH